MATLFTPVQGAFTTTVKTRLAWTITNFSTLGITSKKHYSDVFVDGNGYKWQILIFFKGYEEEVDEEDSDIDDDEDDENINDENNDEEYDEDYVEVKEEDEYEANYLSMCLQVAESTKLPEGWSRFAQFSLSVLNQACPDKSITKGAKKQFDANRIERGFSNFIPLDDLCNPSEGFIMNDTLIFEAEVVTVDSKKETGSLELKNLGTETDAIISLNSVVERESCVYKELWELKNRVFKDIPQNPHYSPLDKYGDAMRKGIMIGLDIAFAHLYEEIHDLEDPQIFWPKHDGFLKQLVELEEMGYNVEKPREHVQLLKGIAAREREASEAVKENEERISELKAEIDILKKDSFDAVKEFKSAAKSLKCTSCACK